ncbi:MAG: VOC family protein [Spirochaetales bacterium]|nr:VOC family protein [Spirochaetales bacterium]
MSSNVQARYTHTNLVARDWRKLSRFYESVFGCLPVPPERDLEGEGLQRGSGVSGVRIRGIHLRLPGYGAKGPTIEVFEYSRGIGCEPPVPNRHGWGHIAFEVDDVPAALQAVVEAGGSRLGEVVTFEVPEAGTITWTYARDPEQNIIELQSWS